MVRPWPTGPCSAHSPTSGRESEVGRGREGRQLRRAEEDRARRQVEGEPPVVSGRRDHRRQRQHRRWHHHLQLRWGQPSTTPSSRTAHSSAATRSSSRRLPSARAPTSAPGRRSPRTCPPGRLGIARGAPIERRRVGPAQDGRATQKKGTARADPVCAESLDTSAPSPSCRCCWTGCGAWSIAATTPRAWRWSAPRASSSGARRASS